MICRIFIIIGVGLPFFCLSGCAGENSVLYGSYSTMNTAKSATLKLKKPNQYEFCYQICSRGFFKTRNIENHSGRIKFIGSPIERYVRQIEVDSYGVRSLENIPESGNVELDYNIGFLFRTAIYIDGGSEVMFVKDK